MTRVIRAASWKIFSLEEDRERLGMFTLLSTPCVDNSEPDESHLKGRAVRTAHRYSLLGLVELWVT